MVKRVTLIRKREAMEPADFERHWLTVHTRLARNLKGVQGYNANVITEWVPGDAIERWDGYGELWFDDLAACDAAFAELSSELEADLENFVSGKQVFFVEEHVIVPRVRRAD